MRSCLAANVSALLLVAPPFNLPRALLTTLSALKRLRGAPSAPRLHVFSVAGGRSGGAWWGEAAAFFFYGGIIVSLTFMYNVRRTEKT